MQVPLPDTTSSRKSWFFVILNKNVTMKKKLLTVPLWERDLYVLIGGKEKQVLRFTRRKKMSHQIRKDIRRDTIDKGTLAAAWMCQKLGDVVM